MNTELYSVHNRRFRHRVNHQVKVQGDNLQGLTLNLSMRGARIVSRHPMRRHFLLRLELDDQPLVVDAERVWEEPLGGGNRVFGVRRICLSKFCGRRLSGDAWFAKRTNVRFMPAPEQQAILLGWLERQAS